MAQTGHLGIGALIWGGDKAVSCGSLRERFSCISSYDSPNERRLVRLDQEMREFYLSSAVSQSYHLISQQANVSWTDEFPLHRAVLNLIQKGNRVIEFSCGTGYAADFICERGADYIGLDLQVTRYISDKQKHPDGQRRFIESSGYNVPIRDGFADMAVSFYALEHMVWPVKYLDEMLRVVKPGGHVALLFPDFIANPFKIMPSVRFGVNPGGLRVKLRRRQFLDLARSLYERSILYRAMIIRLRRDIYQHKLCFMINTAPSCLVSPWTSDTDAVYFASEEEEATYLISKGCLIKMRSRDIRRKDGASIDSATSGNALVVAEVGR